jgi:hypothetical protein
MRSEQSSGWSAVVTIGGAADQRCGVRRMLAAAGDFAAPARASRANTPLRARPEHMKGCSQRRARPPGRDCGRPVARGHQRDGSWRRSIITERKRSSASETR